MIDHLSIAGDSQYIKDHENFVAARMTFHFKAPTVNANIRSDKYSQCKCLSIFVYNIHIHIDIDDNCICLQLQIFRVDCGSLYTLDGG